MLILFLCVVINKIGDYSRIKYLVWAMLVWSVVVQFVGATACTNLMWNTREAYQVTKSNQEVEVVSNVQRARDLMKQDPGARAETIGLNIDYPQYRHRLWSWSDSQILFYIQHYEKAKEIKPLQMDAFRRFG